MLSHVICSKVLCKIVGIKDTRIYWTRFVEEIHEGSNTLMLARVGCALGEKMPTLSHVSGRHAEHRASWALLHRTFMHVVVARSRSTADLHKILILRTAWRRQMPSGIGNGEIYFCLSEAASVRAVDLSKWSAFDCCSHCRPGLITSTKVASATLSPFRISASALSFSILMLRRILQIALPYDSMA
jgi:hypothetical protein